MLKLVQLGNSHRSNSALFEMASDRGGKLEILHWSGSFFLLDGTHKTNIYDLSLLATTVVDSLGLSVSVGFMVTPSENS